MANAAQKKNVVVVGGGNGSMYSIYALKRHADLFNIAAVIAMSDSGGSSGRLREEFQTTPPGDIMRAILAMSSYDSHVLKKIFYKKRFEGCGKLDGHNLGNLFFVLTEKYGGDLMHVVHALEQAIEAVGHVYPSTRAQVNLVAELDNGEQIFGEATIDHPTYDRSHLIKRVWLEPTAPADEGAMTAIRQADAIILGPGNLYTSIIPPLLPAGMKEAIGESKAKLIFLPGNKYDLVKETGPVALSDFISCIEEYLPRPVDVTIYNGSELNELQKKLYAEKQWGVIAYDTEHLEGRRVIDEPFEKPEGGLSSFELGQILKKELSV